MVQKVQGGIHQAAGNKPGGGCRPAPYDLFLGTISDKRAQKVTFPWSPRSSCGGCDCRKGRSFFPPGGRREGRIRPHLVVIAFSPGQAKWKSPEQTLTGADLEVGTKVAPLKTQGSRELPAFRAGNARSLRARQRGPAVPERLSQACEEDLGSVRPLAEWLASARRRFLYSQPRATRHRVEGIFLGRRAEGAHHSLLLGLPFSGAFVGEHRISSPSFVSLSVWFNTSNGKI